MRIKQRRMLIASADALTDKPVKLVVTFTTATGETRNRTFRLYPLSIGSLMKISGKLLRLPTVPPETASEGDIRVFTERMLRQGNNAARIVAYAILNSRQDPSAKLVRFLSDNLTPADLFATAMHLFKGMDTVALEQFYQLEKKRKRLEEEAGDAPPIDTLWTLIGIICKYWKWSEYAVKWRMSYQNAMMYLKTIPVYHSKPSGKKRKGDVQEYETLEDFFADESNRDEDGAYVVDTLDKLKKLDIK